MDNRYPKIPYECQNCIPSPPDLAAGKVMTSVFPDFPRPTMTTTYQISEIKSRLLCLFVLLRNNLTKFPSQSLTESHDF